MTAGALWLFNADGLEKSLDNVRALRGGQITFQREINEDTVTELEKLLDLARQGEIVGLAAVVAYYDNGSGKGLAGKIMSVQSVGSLHCLAAELAGYINREEE